MKIPMVLHTKRLVCTREMGRAAALQLQHFGKTTQTLQRLRVDKPGYSQ